MVYRGETFHQNINRLIFTRVDIIWKRQILFKIDVHFVLFPYNWKRNPFTFDDEKDEDDDDDNFNEFDNNN